MDRLVAHFATKSFALRNPTLNPKPVVHSVGIRWAHVDLQEDRGQHMRSKRRPIIDERPQVPAGFLTFFSGEFQRRLERLAIPGMSDASWDRKAAWLLWKAEHHDRED